MASITRSLANRHPDGSPVAPASSTHFSRRTGYLKNLLGLLFVLFICLPAARAADTVAPPTPTRAVAALNTEGQLLISSRFHTELPDQLQTALQQGVPLHFELRYRLQSPTLAAYRTRFREMVGNAQSIQYKLTYHPLTGGYRVSMGRFSTEYAALPTALRAIGAAANWPVLEPGTLAGNTPSEVAADIRLNLSISDLPRPFQINATTSKDWQLDSGWQKLTINP